MTAPAALAAPHARLHDRAARPRAGDVHGRAGVFWSGLNGMASVVLPFGVFAAFAHWLGPAEFARFGLALAALELLKTLAPQGLYDVLVTHDEGERAYHESASAIFLVSALVTMALYEAFLRASGPLFGLAMPVMAHVLSIKILFDFLLLQPQAALVRRCDVRRLGLRGMLAGAGAGAVGLGLAFWSPGWGLAAFYVTQSLAMMLTTVIGTGALTAPRLNTHAAGQMLGQGLRASGVRISGGITNYFDQLLIGRIFPAQAIGSYNLGKRLEVVSITMASSFAQILWQPSFVIGGEGGRAKALARGVASVALVCGLPVAMLAVLHRVAVPFVFGPNWAGAATVAALLAGSGAIRALGSVAGAALSVTERNGLLLAVSMFSAVTNLAVILIAAPYGLVATAAAVCLRNGLQVVGMFALLKELRGALPGVLWRNFVAPLALATGACWLMEQAALPVLAHVPAILRNLLLLVVCTLAGAGAALPMLLRRI